MAKKASAQQIEHILSSGTAEVMVKDHLASDLKKGDTLRIKLGMDPTAPDLHIGHAVVLRKLRAFQELGHRVVLIVGDYTARIGDPSGKSKTRPALDPREIDKNTQTYFKQVGKILDMKKVEVHKNSEWFKKLSFADLLKLTAHFKVARVIERDDFAKRISSGTDVGFHELLYPVMQAYDSVMVNASVELGGTDQKFNLLAGRELQKKMGMPEQDVLTCPLLIGLDGEKKMSKSLGNYIGITEPPNEMYGKVMTVPDGLLMHYFELAVGLEADERKQIQSALDAGENPRNIKMRLARELVTFYHGKTAALKAEEAFSKIFQKKELPDTIPTKKMRVGTYALTDVLTQIGFADSKTEARRTIEQGGVKVDSAVVTDTGASVTINKEGILIQKGKRFFVRIHS